MSRFSLYSAVTTEVLFSFSTVLIFVLSFRLTDKTRSRVGWAIVGTTMAILVASWVLVFLQNLDFYKRMQLIRMKRKEDAAKMEGEEQKKQQAENPAVEEGEKKGVGDSNLELIVRRKRAMAMGGQNYVNQGKEQNIKKELGCNEGAQNKVTKEKSSRAQPSFGTQHAMKNEEHDEEE